MRPDNETLQRWIHAACLAEATARKPGNVHPGASFDDLTYDDFVRSAHAASPVLARATAETIGRTIWEAVEATQSEVRTNTNLGICLLLAPMVASVRAGDLRGNISSVLAGTTREDAAWVYRAIRAAVPGGLGKVNEQDIANEPTETLLEVMQRAADRDRVAWQYATGYSDIFDIALPCLQQLTGCSGEKRVIALHLQFMSEIPDTLIARKCGIGVAQEAAKRAAAVLGAGWPRACAIAELESLDAWLRGDGHRRNPGTTADLVAASLLAALAEDLVTEEQLTFGRMQTLE